ncbi:MAG: ribonuclease P protein component [Verrucomicrobia bacterium]|nr:MAG: ribonuclease P protein component [Verrucomicrobiota bacterium]
MLYGGCSQAILPVRPIGILPVVCFVENRRDAYLPHRQDACATLARIRIMSRKQLSFPKTKRLTLSAEFARVKGQGTTERGRYLVLGAAKVSEEKTFRAGFITPKHIGTAVVRNRVRRRLRDILRTEQARLRPGIWLVVVARPYAVNASYAQLKDEWLRLAERASILAP